MSKLDNKDSQKCIYERYSDKKILFITDSLSGGGAERVLVLLANEFARQGINTTILSLKPIMNYSYFIEENVKVIVPPKNNKRHWRLAIQTIIDIRNIVKSERYTEIISFLLVTNVYVLLATLFLNIPVFVSERCDPGNIKVKEKEKFFYIVSKLLYLKASGVVFQTEYVKKYYNRWIQKRSKVIANPVNRKMPIADKKTREKVIISAGRLTEQKNQEMLIRVFAKMHNRYPDYRLVIYGEGPLRSKLEEAVRTLKIEDAVSMPGFVPDLPNKISKSMVFVLPSNFEGIPNVVMEAMAIGVPVIATDCPVGGVRMLIEDGRNGLIVPVGDEVALENQLEKALNDENLLDMLSDNAIEIRDLYSVEKIVEEWLRFIG